MWTRIDNDPKQDTHMGGTKTYRMDVPGGYLIRVLTIIPCYGFSQTMVFVPAPVERGPSRPLSNVNY